jgi:hypothetical protein
VASGRANGRFAWFCISALSLTVVSTNFFGDLVTAI